MEKDEKRILIAAINELMDKMDLRRLRLLYITALAWAGGEK